MNKDPKGNPAPAGGFQNLGWYSGYQYYNGSFAPQAGVIHPQSPQQGAGQMVSKEVNAQSAAAQGKTAKEIEDYIASQNKQYTPAPTSVGYQGNAGKSSTGSYDLGAGAGFNQPKIDLPAMYKNLYSEKGIADIQKKLADADQAKADAESKINDNPFLSEATRVGRVQKLNIDYENRTKGWRDELATKKADIETELNIQTKQFDINSQQAQLALSQFNTLLQAGAFDNASGDDIASVTRATGLSSNMIASAVNARREANIQTSTVQWDDGTNTGFAIINSKTGEIISKQTIAASKPTSTNGKATEGEQKQYYADLLRTDARSGLTLSQILAIYSGYLDPNTIYSLYNANSKYGPDKNPNAAKLAQYGITLKNQ